MGVRGFLDRLKQQVTRSRDTEAHATERLARVLLREATYDKPGDFFAAVIAVVPEGQTLPEASARLLVKHLRPWCDGYGERNSQAVKEMEQLWRELFRRSGDPFVGACYGEALLQRGKKHRAMQLFIDVFTRRPDLFFEFGNGGSGLDQVAASLGPEAVLDYRLLRLRAYLDSETDEVRELYSELLDEYAEQPEALRRLQEVGAEIDQAVQAGKLPRALVRRGSSRRDRAVPPS